MHLEIAYFSRAINSRDFNEHSERRECSSLYDTTFVYRYICISTREAASTVGQHGQRR